MRISPELLARLLLYSLCFGAFLAALNGAFRALFVLIDGEFSVKKTKAEQNGKKFKILKGIYTFTVDFFIVTLGGVGVILLCYYFNDGEFRGFSLFGILLGFVLTHISLGKLIKYLFGMLFLALRRLIFGIFTLALYPLRKILLFCKKLLKKIANKIYNTLAKKRKVVYNKDEELFIYSIAQNGFLDLSGFGLVNGDFKSSEEQKNGQKSKNR